MSPEPPFVEKEETEEPIALTDLEQCKPGLFLQRWQATTGIQMQFTIRVPENYSDSNSSPLVVALHYGASQDPRNLGKIMMDELVQPAVGSLTPILLAPRLINQSWLDPDCESSVIALVEKVMATYNIDRERVFIVGYGIGATGAWHYTVDHPDLFKFCIAVSGGIPDNFNELKADSTMLAIHSKTDELFSHEPVAAAVRQLNNAGNQNVELVTIEVESHYFINDFIPALKKAFQDISKNFSSKSNEQP